MAHAHCRENIAENSREYGRRRRMIIVIFSVLLVIYEELILNWFTVRTFRFTNLQYMVLFSAAYGILLFWGTSLFRSPRANRLFRFIVYVLTCDICGVYYFIYRTFKVFYDVSTVSSGGEGAAVGFQNQIIAMTTSRSGLMHIFLFLLPVLIYFLFLSRIDSGRRRSGKELILLYTGALACSVAALFLVFNNTMLRRVYADEYSFQSAVSDFGLLTGLRLDCEQLLTSRYRSVNFAEEAAEPVSQQAAAQPGEETEKQIYGRNRLEIDFISLAKDSPSSLQALDSYVRSQTASSRNDCTGLFAGKNLIFLSAEAFSAEAIDPSLTPTLYRLAEKGIRFTDYYQPASAGTTGGEYENVFGLLPSAGGSSFKLTSSFHNVMTMGWQLNRQGYNGWAFHDNDYTFYDRHITHNNLGYSNGFIAYGNGLENSITSQWPQSDLEMMEATVDLYIDQQPFNIYYMTVSGHNPYDTGNRMSMKHWEEVKDLEGKTDAVKCYLAANIELDHAMEYLLKRLEEKGILNDTVIVLAADHFPYGLDYGEDLNESDNLANLYGYRPENYLERDHNRLILWSGCLEQAEPMTVDTPVSSLDILPTLLNLFGLEWDSRLLPGRDVFSDRMPLVFNLNYDWKTDKGTYIASTGTFTPCEGTEVNEAYVERIRTIVSNKVSYCKGVLSADYFWHVMKPMYEEETGATEDSAAE